MSLKELRRIFSGHLHDISFAPTGSGNTKTIPPGSGSGYTLKRCSSSEFHSLSRSSPRPECKRPPVLDTQSSASSLLTGSGGHHSRHSSVMSTVASASRPAIRAARSMKWQSSSLSCVSMKLPRAPSIPPRWFRAITTSFTTARIDSRDPAAPSKASRNSDKTVSVAEILLSLKRESPSALRRLHAWVGKMSRSFDKSEDVITVVSSQILPTTAASSRDESYLQPLVRTFSLRLSAKAWASLFSAALAASKNFLPGDWAVFSNLVPC